MKTNWFKLLTPILQMFESIDNDGAGPDQISLNNQQLVREMENNKQSSIEWLESEIGKLHAQTTIEISLFQQAKEKHKQETINAYKKGFLSDDIKLADDYYKQNYGK
jgi:hypothetical protein